MVGGGSIVEGCAPHQDYVPHLVRGCAVARSEIIAQGSPAPTRGRKSPEDVAHIGYAGMGGDGGRKAMPQIGQSPGRRSQGRIRDDEVVARPRRQSGSGGGGKARGGQRYGRQEWVEATAMHASSWLLD